MNKGIDEIYELIDNYRTPTEPANNEPADSEPANPTPAEPVDGEQAGNGHNTSMAPLPAAPGPRHNTAIDNNSDGAQHAPTPPRAPP